MQIISDIAQANLFLREYLASRFAYTVNLKQNSTWEYLAIPYIQLRSSIMGIAHVISDQFMIHTEILQHNTVNY